jgi:ABC-type multidrug transport system fused ATPase/permease subunit
MLYFLLTQRIISFMFFLVILDIISTATTVLTKHVFTTIKSHHTFNQTHKIYTQTTEKVLFLKSLFSNCNHNNYSKNKHSLRLLIQNSSHNLREKGKGNFQEFSLSYLLFTLVPAAVLFSLLMITSIKPLSDYLFIISSYHATQKIIN